MLTISTGLLGKPWTKYIEADKHILKIAKHIDLQAPLEYLWGLAYNYDMHWSFIHVYIHFIAHNCDMSVSKLVPKRMVQKSSTQMAGAI